MYYRILIRRDCREAVRVSLPMETYRKEKAPDVYRGFGYSVKRFRIFYLARVILIAFENPAASSLQKYTPLGRFAAFHSYS